MLVLERNDVRTIRCVTSRKIYDDGLYVIMDCKVERSMLIDGVDPFQQIRDHAWTFVAKGYGLQSLPGISIVIAGKWVEDAKHGQLQFEVSACRDDVGLNRADITDYLTSVLTGVGPKTAELIYDEFGADTLNILETEPKKLLRVHGIGPEVLKTIIESYEKNREYNTLTKMLAQYGISFRSIVRISRILGDRASALIRINPYVLCKVPDFGFTRVDEIARRMGFDRHSPFRIEGGIYYTFTEFISGGGHTYADREAVISLCTGSRVLNSRESRNLRPETNPSDITIPVAETAEDTTVEEPEGSEKHPELQMEVIEHDEVDTVLSEMIAKGKLLSIPSADGGREQIYLPDVYEAEYFASRVVASRLLRCFEPKIDWSKHLETVQEKTGLTLDPDQYAAALTALENRTSIITGGPGTGKSTILMCIADAYAMRYPECHIQLAAPTGRAARRMEEQTRRSASTLHKLMKITPDEYSDFNTALKDGSDIQSDLLIIDEASMIDVFLFAELMYRLSERTKLVIIGDPDQLPSVGPGDVLRELLKSGIPTARLTTIHRQKKDSVIPVNAEKIRTGKTDLVYNSDFSYIRCETAPVAADTLCDIIAGMNPGHRSMYQVLSPRRINMPVSVRELNIRLQEKLNPPEPGKAEADISGIMFRTGDPVIATRNSDMFSNGDLGKVIGIYGEVSNKAEFRLLVDFSGIRITMDYETALDLDLAYAVTVHKSQGSEFPAVIVPIFREMGTHFMQRNLIYTAITRAKRRVVILTNDENTIKECIRTYHADDRKTNLNRFIQLSIANL